MVKTAPFVIQDYLRDEGTFRAYQKEMRNEIIEECARVSENMDGYPYRKEFAAAIRKLKQEQK